MDKEPKPRALDAVGNTVPVAIKAPINLEQKLNEILPECFARIEAMDYAGAFHLFAQQLEFTERTSPTAFFNESSQKPIRQKLGLLWNHFLKDIKDDQKKDIRLRALRGQTDEALEKVRTALKQDSKNVISDDARKYLTALASQRDARGTIAVFPNEPSISADFRRKFDLAIDNSIGRLFAEASAAEFKHMDYIGELFNNVLPFLRTQMEGYVKPLLEGRRGYSNYTPVTSAIIQADIIAYLEQAPRLAQTFAELLEKRDDANESARKSVQK